MNKKKKKKFFNFDLPDVLPEIPNKMNFYRSKQITKDRKKEYDGYTYPTGPSKKKKKK